ncbi:MAG TPA: class I SAM-dependent methyltransferase [Pyrinomonadaceae bacterium]|jgi:SAM-dependent methyltransferase|nr:class I SAM-dependent methyltransferase [Pyrinomonadaceae bacterium]
MIDDISDIADLYDRSVEQEHSRLDEHQLEYDLTWRYLKKYLPRSGTILEIGAATGRYTLPLCRLGYQVTAVDLSAALIAENERQLAVEQFPDPPKFAVADARDLSAVTDTQLDVVLLMGPLYHLVEAGDRRRALQEAIGRLRPGGLIFSAFLSRLGVLGDLLQRMPGWIERREEVRSFIENGRRPGEAPRGGFRGYFSSVSEIAPLHESLGIETLVLAGIEPAISADDESYNNLGHPQRELWLDLFFDVSTDPSTTGASRHLLYIGRKKESET